MTPLYGKLADIHGRRVLMLIAIGTFVAGSVACALAPGMTELVLGRAFQGLGGGGLMALAQTIIADIVSPRERGRYQGYIGAVFATSSVGGPVLGGFLTEHIDWSLIFWINLPLGLVALGMTSSVLRRVPFSILRKHSASRYHRRAADDVGRRSRPAARAIVGRAELRMDLWRSDRRAAAHLGDFVGPVCLAAGDDEGAVLTS